MQAQRNRRGNFKSAADGIPNCSGVEYLTPSSHYGKVRVFSISYSDFIMQKINNINVNDEIKWIGGKNLDRLMAGVIVERVRAKTRPKHEKIAAGIPTKREVSFIARSCGHLFWVGADHLVIPRKKKIPPKISKASPVKRGGKDGTAKPTSKPVAKNASRPKKASQQVQKSTQVSGPVVFGGLTTPIVPRQELARVWPFKNSDYSSLDKYLTPFPA